MVRSVLAIVVACVSLATVAVSQDPQSTTCTFTDGKSIRITYAPAPVAKELTYGQQWSPGNQPMLFFTEGGTVIAGAQIPIGAYRLYVVPEKTQWILVVNRNVNAGAAYNKSDDLVRAPMQLETLPVKESTFEAYLGHIAPQQCSLRLDYGKTRATVQIDEKP